MFSRLPKFLVVTQIIGDSLLGMAAFALAYFLRFESALFSIPKGTPAFEQYLILIPFIGLLVPFSFYLQGAYNIRRNRTRVDDFFSVLVSNIFVVVIGIVGTLYFQVYVAGAQTRSAGTYEVSRLVWLFFLTNNIALAYLSRETLRTIVQKRFKAGLGLKRVLIAGTGDLARHVADKILQHSEFGYQIIGFVDDKAATDTMGYRGLPVLGQTTEAAEIIQDEQIDQLYVALPLEEHEKMLALIEVSNRECIEVKVVPDLLHVIALRARLEDLDGVPIININDVPLQGVGTLIKRAIDIVLSSSALIVLAIPFAIIATVIRTTSPGNIFYRQERMGLDRHPFMVLKFRSMHENAELNTGPVWARENDPRRTLVGSFLRRFSLDELPQFLNVLKGDMSLVGPRPERPFFVEQFRDRIPQYMLRHKVKSGLTGWAQVNGWRGNTSIEKRIEYDLYYIENWSISLDFKILWLTVIRVLFHRHAY
tara:strand:- start:1507 stop:2946 length:1440 start_codon:yes stop_codon:yes gene_type:complete